MRKRVLFIMCTTIILISVAIDLYNHFILIPLRSQTYIDLPLSTVNVYVAKPAFWICIGILATSAALRTLSNKWISGKSSRICLWIGAMIIVAYWGVTALVLFAEYAMNNQILLISLMWLAKSTPVFIIPGLLIGIGLNEKKHSEIQKEIR